MLFKFTFHLKTLSFFLFIPLLNFAQGTWTQKASYSGQGREGTSGFSIGSKGYIGTGLGFFNDFWEWDQTTNTWTQKANFPGAARAEDIGFSIGTKGYIGMGWGGNEPSIMFKDFYEYDQAGNSWAQKPDFPGPCAMGRAGSIGISIGNFGYVGMGSDTNSTNYNDWWQYDPASNSWSQKANFAGSSRQFPVAFSIGTKGYIGTGNTGFVSVKDFYEYDPSSNSWTQKANLPASASGRWQAYGYGHCGKGYVGCGASDIFFNNLLVDFYEYDQSSNSWTQMANFPGGMRREGATFAIGGLAYLSSGSGGLQSFPPTGYNDLWEFASPSFAQITITPSPNSICAGQSFNFTATSTGSVSSWNWTFTGGTPSTSTQQNPTGITYNTAGTFIVTLAATIPGVCGGTFTKTDTVDVIAPPTTAFIAGSTNICTGGSAVLSAGGGDTYVWSTGQTTQVITVTPSSTTTYIVTATNACGSDTAQITVNVGGGSLTVNTSSTLASCGQCNGTATVTASGGSGSYLYSWSNGQTTASVTGLCAGTYSVTVSENSGGGNTVFYSEDFTSGGSGWTLNTNGPGTNDANANGWVVNNNGNCDNCGTSAGNKLHITCNSTDFFCPAMGGPGCVYNAGGLSAIATDKFASSAVISTLAKSNMTLKFWYVSEGEAGSDYGLVRLFNGITWTDLVTQYSGTPTCTQATINIPAAYENLTNFKIGFRWINDNNTNGDDPPFTIDDIELSAPSGGGSCTNSSTVTVNSSSGMMASVSNMNDATCGASNGSATASQSGGSSPYTYNWSNGQTGQTDSALAAGNYFVTITDASGCTATTAATIGSSGGPSAITSANNATCNGINDGSAIANASGGTSPYTYLWSNAATTQTITGLGAGNYNVTVTDANNCTATASATVSGGGIPTATASSNNVSCNGGSNGSAMVTLNNGTSPYTYNWDNGDTTQSISNLGAGTYSVTATDANGCFASAVAIVNQPTAISDTTSSINASCGASDGSASVLASGGISPYSYNWSNGQTSQNATGLASGSYSVTITDANNCTNTATATVSNANAPTVSTSLTAPTCTGDNNGTATVSASGGTSPYTYLWSNGDNSITADSLSAGIYSVTVADNAGCIAVNSVTLVDPNPITVTISETPNDTVCLGSVVSLTAFTLGSAPYAYLWSDSTTSTTNTVNFNSDTTYYVTSTDANGCKAMDSISLAVSSASVSISGNNAICKGQSATLIATGANTYLWSVNNETNDSIVVSPISDNSYWVIGTDNIGCSDTDTVVVNVNLGIDAVVSNDTTIGYGATVQIVATGGDTYSWSTGESGSSITATLEEDKTFVVTVTDASGCSDIDTINIKVECRHEISIPTAFSPNNDNVNDFIKVHGYGFKELEFTIYDRWGEKIITLADKNEKWDGTFKGSALNSAVFVYTLKVKFCDDTEYNEKGNITLLR